VSNFLLLILFPLFISASPYSHLPAKDSAKLHTEGRRICESVKKFSQTEKDVALEVIYKRHCLEPKAPLLTGLLIGIYHLDIDTKNPQGLPRIKARKLFYKKQLTKISLLVARYPDFSTPPVLFNLARNVSELSGFTYFKSTQTIWSHGDSGTPTAVAQTSLLDQKSVTFQMAGSQNFDWEAIASDSENIWVLDVGDNKSVRKTVSIYRFLAADAQNGRVERVNRFDLSYPDAAMDCEAGVYHDGAIYLFQKKYYQPAKVYRIAIKDLSPQPPELIGTYPALGPITDATLNDKNELFVLTYFGVFEIKNWREPKKASVRTISNQTWGQTESITHIKDNLFWVGREDGNVYELRDTKPLEQQSL
jgi:hypothetical protein